jgi:hypothetical protein
MRLRAYPPLPCSYERMIIYVHSGNSVYLFFSTSRNDAVDAEYYTHWYPTLEEAQEVAKMIGGVSIYDWVEIPDPLPHAQHDLESPIFVQRDKRGEILLWLEYDEAQRRGLI